MDAAGASWHRTYDQLNRLRSQADPLGNTTEYFYDSTLGNLVRMVKPDGREITYDYNVRRLTAVHLPGGGSELITFDSSGRPTAIMNAEISREYAYDAEDRLLHVTDISLGQTINYTYDQNGNLASMDGPAGQISYFYDSLNQLVEQRDPVAGTFHYRYDLLGRRTALEYPNGLETTYDYDNMGRLGREHELALAALNTGLEGEYGMTWQLCVGLAAIAVVLFALWHIGYSIIYLYIFLAAASGEPRRGRWIRRWFKPIARFSDENRMMIDPEALAIIDARMTRNTPRILKRLGWGCALLAVFVVFLICLVRIVL